MAQVTAALPATTGRYRWYVLFVMFLVYTSNQVDRQILPILLEPIRRDLALTDTQLGLLSSLAFALFYTTLGIPAALWADRGNRRNIIALAVAVWSSFTVLCGYAATFVQLLLARMGVAIGESAGTPPAHSIIAELFAPRERGFAMAIYTLGLPIGILIGLVIGGVLADAVGWRTAFVVVGLPGLLLALVVLLTVREPPRTQSGGTRQTVTLRDGLARILAQRSLRHVLAGSAVTSFVGYAVSTWLPSYFVRSFGMKVSEAGFSLAPVIGICGIVGLLGAGWLSDRLSQRDPRWSSQLVAIALWAALPFAVGVYLAPAPWIAVLLYVIPAVVAQLYLAPSFALAQSLVPASIGALSSAFLLFTMNLVGMGLGPLWAGVLSDWLQPRFGDESLRYALLSVVLLNAWAGWHYWRGGRYIAEDMARARAAAGA